MTRTTLGYWVEAAGRGALRPVALPDGGDGAVLLTATHGGISPGTERLVGLGRVPHACAAAMAVPGMQGSFALPVLYGYSLVGAVAAGSDAGRRAFVMQPHQQLAVVPRSRLVWLPDEVPSPRATLFPNLETAWNAVADAELAPGERVAVVGAGAVGLLLAFVLAAQHRGDVVLVERDPQRRAFAAGLPWVTAALAPDAAERGGCAVAFHATGSGDGLQLAIDLVGLEGRVLDLAWYGDQPVTLRLGETFHHQRKRLVATQVGMLARAVRAAGPAARTAAVLALLLDPGLDRLPAAAVPFAALPQFFDRLYRGEATPPCPVVGY